MSGNYVCAKCGKTKKCNEYAYCDDCASEVPDFLKPLLNNPVETNLKYKKMWEKLKNTFRSCICPPKYGELQMMREIEKEYEMNE